MGSDWAIDDGLGERRL